MSCFGMIGKDLEMEKSKEQEAPCYVGKGEDHVRNVGKGVDHAHVEVTLEVYTWSRIKEAQLNSSKKIPLCHGEIDAIIFETIVAGSTGVDDVTLYDIFGYVFGNFFVFEDR